MPYLQELIHKLEVGPWFRYIRFSLPCLALVILVVGYNGRSFRNLGTQEAMDAAQVARNVSEGKGYTTLFIRPLSVHLVKKRNEAKLGLASPGQQADHAQLKSMHPDLANPPFYPLVLAGWMKVYSATLNGAEAVRQVMPGFIKRRLLPFTDSPDNKLWRKDERFWWHPHDFLIGLFNQALFFAVVVMTFFLSRKLFDAGVAWLSAVVLLGCELLWRFSVSGLSTMLLLLIFSGLAWCLVLIEGEAREPRWGAGRLILLAAAAGLLVGLGMLTRYAFGWVIIPVLLFFILFTGQRRMVLAAATLGMFFLVAGPWIYRNYSVSGTPFGTAGFAVVEGAGLYAEHQLQRSLEPDYARNILRPLIVKLLNNSRQILQNDLPRLGGNWIMPFFLVGLLIGFRSLAIRRLRYFLVGTLALLVIVQALGRTQLSEDSPEINSENLLVLLMPLVAVYGVSLFFLLLDQMGLMFQGLRFMVIGAFGLVMCLPMIYSFLPPRPTPVAYPPYYPPVIQQTAGWMGENELMMSDIPWAVAWYGRRQCLWLTLNAQAEFFKVNDYLKPVRALYLTPQTMDNRFLTQWVRPGEHSWGSFILASLVSREIPANFPLRKAPTGFLPEQLFLTDWERWKKRTEDSSP
jgi:hypothetical protein